MWNPFKVKPPLQFVMIVRDLITYVLPNSPATWDGCLIEVKRDDKYFGLIRTFTVPMDFVLDGAWILRTEFYQYGLRGDVQIQINELNTDTQAYEQIYIGQVDFSNIKDTGALDGYKFTCNILPNDMVSLINAYEDTSFEIPIDINEALLIQIPGIALNEQATLNFSTSPDHRSNAFFALVVVTNKINAIYPSVQNSGFVQQDSPDFTTTGEWFFRSQCVNNVVSCYGNMGVQIAPNGANSRYRITIRRSSDGSIVNTLFDQTTSVTFPYQFSWNFIMDGIAGRPTPLALYETLSCYFENFDGDGNKGFQMENGNMYLSYNTLSPPTLHKALPPKYVFDFLIKGIYGLEFIGFTFPTQSNILSTAPWNQLCITSGDAFRPALVELSYFSPGDPLTPGVYYTVVNGPSLVGGTVTYNGMLYNIGDMFLCVATNLSFTSTGGAIVESGNTPAVIKTTLKSFFKSLNSVLNLGMDVQSVGSIETVVLEKKETFFNQSLPIVTLSNIQKFSLTPYINYISNSIKAGYPDQTYDVLSGRKEANSTVQYSTPNNKAKKELDLTSEYRADPYGIEFLRIQEGSQNVTNGDNGVFLIMRSKNLVAGQLYYCPEGTSLDGDNPYTVVSGVDVGYFNFSITPMQNLLRYSNFLAGMLYNWEGQIKLASALKSTTLITVDTTGKTVVENQPVDIGTLGKPLFLPYVATITTDLPVNMLAQLDKYPTGYISFVVDGNTYYGFLISAKVDPAKNKSQEYQVLLTNANNLLTLIQ